MRLWRVSASAWERPSEATPWFDEKTRSIVVYHASPLAAALSRLSELRLSDPERMDEKEQLFSLEVNRKLIQTAKVTRHWHLNRKETRDLATVWRLQSYEPVLRVPSMGGAEQFLVNLKSPQLNLLKIHCSGTRCLQRSLQEARGYLSEGAEWLAVR